MTTRSQVIYVQVCIVQYQVQQKISEGLQKHTNLDKNVMFA